MKYPKEGSLKKYFDDMEICKKVHNMLKHGEIDYLCRYQPFLKSAKDDDNKNNDYKNLLK